MRFNTKFIYLFFVAFVASFMLMFAANTREAISAECSALIFKFADPDDGTVFRFDIDEDGDTGISDLASGENFPIFFTGSATVVEDPPPGWIVDHIQCNNPGGVTITEIRNGLEFECGDFVGTVEFNCSFFNVIGRESQNIPTLSEWGMIGAALGLGFVGLFFAVRRRKAQAA